jgi:hypothetical protein
MERGIQMSGAFADFGAEELGRRDADDVEDGVAELEPAAEDGGSPAKAALPPCIADDGYGMIAFAVVVGVGEHTADLGLHAEGLKIGAGDELDIHGLGSTDARPVGSTKPWT